MQLGNPQSFNRYSYVENQPTNFVDPSGLQMRLISYNCWCVNGNVPGWTDPNPRCETCYAWIDDGGGGGGPTDFPTHGDPGGGGGGDSGGGGGGGGGGGPIGPAPSSNPPSADNNKEYKDCVKAETRACKAQGRAYFNDNFYNSLLYGPAAGAIGTGIFAAGKKAGWWGAIKMGVGTVAAKAGPYVTVVASALAIRDLAQAGVAIENACKTNIDELCRRRAGLL